MKLDSKRTDRLPRKRLLRLGAAVALATAAFGAQGAGLGRLNVLSSIGQPLRAEIELTSVAGDEALTAKLASPDAFAQANIDYGAALTTLRFSVQRRANGTPYVLVTSNQLVNEPFLDVLVELSWSAGRLVREYTLLIDPPNNRDAQREVEPGAVIVQAQTPVRAPAVRRPAPPPALSVASPPSPGAGASPAAAPGASTGSYVVRAGDTAMSISRDNRPEGVSLEQMLAALYRDNPQAFGGNINRLMAGATVNIPEASSAKALDGSEARRIMAQSSDFGAYRERVARNAAQAPTSRVPGQQASGKLTAQVDDGSVPAGEAKDRLQLSRPDANTKAASAGSGARSGVAGPSVEDLAAKDRELQETKTRLALLEKNVADLQQLLALKNQSLADLQKGATKAPDVAAPVAAPAPPVAVAPPVAIAPVVAAPVVVAPVAAPPPVVAPPAPAPAVVAEPAPVKPAPAPVKAAPTTTVTEQSWFDSVVDNSMLLVGLIAIVVLLVAYGIFTVRRRRKLSRFEDSIFVDNSVLHANSVFGTTGGQSVDTANSGFHSNFVPVAGNLPEQNEVDPVAEADVYIAYGRDAQAEEILKEALRADPNRHAVHLKLLEIYAKRADAKTFETVASELYAATGGQGDDWKQAATLGQTIDPHNPLYTDVATPAVATVVTPRPQPSRDASSIGDTYAGAAGLTASDLAMGDPSAYSEHPVSVPIAVAEHTRTDPMPRPEPLAATSAPSMDLDFDLGFANAGLAPLPPAASATSTTPTTAPGPRDSGLDFDVGGSAKPLIDPFTASAFGAGDSSARTAVNLPAFRARAEKEPPPRPDSDGFSASDIFGSSIIPDTEVQYSEAPQSPVPTPTPTQARTQDFRQVVDSNQFDKTEPLDAFSNINLDLDNGGYESTNVSPDFGTRTDVWQAMATKLDLALAYSDIGDKEGARELLEEVVRNGDATQATRARQLIGELG